MINSSYNVPTTLTFKANFQEKNNLISFNGTVDILEEIARNLSTHLDKVKISLIFCTPSWSSCLLMPDRSVHLLFQKAISSSGPLLSLISNASCALRTSLIWRVQWMTDAEGGLIKCCEMKQLNPYNIYNNISVCISTDAPMMNAGGDKFWKVKMVGRWN